MDRSEFLSRKGLWEFADPFFVIGLFGAVLAKLKIIPEPIERPSDSIEVRVDMGECVSGVAFAIDDGD